MYTVLATVVALIAVVVVVRVAVGARSREVPSQDQPGTVLLVPGYGGSTGSLQSLAAAIRATGRTVLVVAVPDGGTGDLHRQADAVDAVAEVALRDAPSVDVVGYSAGGVVVRLWVQEHDGARKARRVITLGSPHHGAGIAAAGGAVIPGACPLACQQLAPGSRLLAGLVSPVPQPPAWLSIWTEQDQTVTPAESAELDGAANVDIQVTCPGRQVSHGQLPSDAYVTGLVLRAIRPAGIGAPPRC
jgi:triacylglycerol lipase